MAYTKQGFKDGDTLHASQLVKMEEAIIEAQAGSGSGGVTEEQMNEAIREAIGDAMEASY